MAAPFLVARGFAQKPASAQKLDCQNRSAQKVGAHEKRPSIKIDGLSGATADGTST
jgi:hypothetical protein